MEGAEFESAVPLGTKGDLEASLLQFNGQQGREMLKFMPNGDIFVQGRLAANDTEVVDGIREWLKASGFFKPIKDNKDGEDNIQS